MPGAGTWKVGFCAGSNTVAINNTDYVSGWVEGQHLGFPVVRDAHDIVVSRYGVNQYPTTFVVDQEGYVAAIGVARADLETSLDTVLQGFYSR